MFHRFSFFLILSLFSAVPSYLIGAATGKIEALISLEPAGSFKAASSELVILGKKTEKSYELLQIEIPVASLKTGINLRDEHLQKRLKGDKIIGKNFVIDKNKGTFDLTMNQVTKKISFTYDAADLSGAKASFAVNLPDFDIKDLTYLEIGVSDEMTVEVVLHL